jgi:PAS domain S-box-containing protein
MQVNYRMINYQLLFETLADGVFVAQDYQFVYCNPALSDMLGYQHHEFIGLHFNQVISPDYINLWTERFEQRIGTGKEPDKCYEVQFLRIDGKPLWVELRANRSEFKNRPAVLGIIRNISERYEILNALILSQFVIDHSSIEVYQIDSDGHIQYANQKACQSLGYTAEEILNLSIPDIDPIVQRA